MATRYIQGNNEVQGSSDGVAPAAGYVGEVKFTTQTFSGLGANPTVNGAATTITPGIWLCVLRGSFQNVVPTEMFLALANNADVVIDDSYGALTSVDCGNNSGGGNIQSTCVLRVTSDTTYKVRASSVQTAGAIITVQFQAVRIA